MDDSGQHGTTDQGGEAGAPAAETAAPDEAHEAERARLLAAEGPERERLLREIVRSNAGTVLSADIADDSNFLESGLNSLTALELTKTLMNITGLEIPMVAIVEHPTPADLGRYLAEELDNAPVA
ncbi:acyl carrier protein [Actinomadura graeca]|uniref:Acyl carrier protein n=1 Tax=Actinomadura graeca TaxID=2750812 RepID=A0ABX8R4Z7_9ACTN|nr:acyl carrier protein [Actinomadura graeca]QXJ26151.1 acyl carrier protein [Actinomadura graeca]